MEFFKIQGTGNHFIIINNLKLKLPLEKIPEIVKHLCREGFSIGADGLMVVDTPTQGGDFKMRFYNADGSTAEMCGNGARCIARYAVDNGIASPDGMNIETMAGMVQAWAINSRNYRIRLNYPTLVELSRNININGEDYNCGYVELGNPPIPHAVVPYKGLATADLEKLRELGSAIRFHHSFPKGANVNFYEITAPNTVIEKTFERGVEDFTLACGTGSGAVAVIVQHQGLCEKGELTLQVAGGTLTVDIVWDKGEISEVFLQGDTNIVCKGVITDEDLRI